LVCSIQRLQQCEYSAQPPSRYFLLPRLSRASVCLTVLHATRGHSVAYVVTAVTCVILVSRILLFMTSLGSITKREHRCKIDNEAKNNFCRFGDVVVSVLATGLKGCGFKTRPRRWILRAIKVRSSPSSRMGSKAGRSHVVRFYGM
jgi:hypothetical protein